MSFTVTSTSPGFSATDIYLNVAVTIEFSKNVLASSVSEMTVMLVEADTNKLVNSTVTVSAPKKIQITPKTALKGNTRYRATVLGSEWGVLSAASDTLAETVTWTFTTGLYTDTEDTEDQIPAGVDPEEEPTDEEIYLVSSVPDNLSVGVGIDSVQLKFTGLVPSGAYVEVDATHPLGYPAPANHWTDNLKTVVDGDTITVVSSGDLAASLDSSLAFTDELPYVDQDAIIISESGDVNNDLRHVRFGLDPNSRYQLRVRVPSNKFVPTIEFSSVLIPRFVTVDELRLASGISLNRFDDFVLDNMLHQISKTAKGIWTSRGHTWPSSTPYYVKEYVLYRTLRDMLSITLRDSGSESTSNQRLGELTLRSNPDSKSLLEELRNLDLMVVLLGEKVKAGNTGAEPITGPAWVEASKASKATTPGLSTVDQSGRAHPRERTDFSRSIRSQTKRRRN